MRPEKLELQYFGPYEHTVIDFNQFQKRPLFLVGGNTGAGKTTIFDAMCYALFGQTTNDRDRSAGDLRSDFAPADKETKVVFTFVHQGKQYRITRHPKQNLRGRRGKLVEHSQKVSLIYPLGSDHPHEITKIGDAERFITHLLNMTRDQFKQIVLLPQGKFRQFLDSDSDAKNKLLSDLFQTQRYGEWADKLKERLKDSRGKLADQEKQLQAKKETVADADAQLPDEEWLAAANKLTSRLADKQALLTKEEEKEQAAADKLRARLREGQELHQYRQDLQDATAVLHKLEGQSLGIDRLRAQVADLHWFRDHQGDYQRLTDTSADLSDAKQTVCRLADQLKDLQGQVKQTQQTVAELASQQDQITAIGDQARELKGKLPLFTVVDGLKEELAVVKEQAAGLEEARQEAEHQLDRHTSQLTALKRELVDRDELAKQQVELEQGKGNLHILQQAGHQLAADQQALADERDRYRQLTAGLAAKTAAAEQARDRLVTLRDTYARQQIARLAKELKPGAPCPVCGATDHPHPAVIAVSEGKTVTDDQVKQAENRSRQADSERDKLAAQAQQAGAQVKKLQAQVKSDQTAVAAQLGQAALPADWQAAIDQQDKQLADSQSRLEQTLAAADKQEQEAEKLRVQIDADRTDLQSAKEKVQAVKQKLVEKQTSLNEKQASLPADFADAAATKEQVAVWTKRAADYNARLEQAKQQLEAQTRQIAVAENSKKQEQERIGVLNDKQAQLRGQLKAALSQYKSGTTWNFWQEEQTALPKLAGMEGQVADYDRQLHDARQERQRLTKLVNGRPEPDLQALEGQVAVQEKHVQECQREIGQLQAQQEQVARSVTAVKKIMKKMGKANQALANLQTLTDVVTGNNESHLSLERYVLQAYFKEVLQAANIQLDRLTNGRYQFELARESHGTGNKWTGLEINVYDDNAGCSRSARTLSGGESFIASLALALALCQIIQEQNGGIQIDALFIDEGFGSLDQDALADALRTLEEIEGHRMIGIISHVTELEEQIPDQLRVESRDGRSTVSYRHEI